MEETDGPENGLVSGPDAGPLRGAGRRARIAWCLYDWANSSFPAVILTFVFAAYFTRGVAVTPVQGTGLWAAAPIRRRINHAGRVEYAGWDP